MQLLKLIFLNENLETILGYETDNFTVEFFINLIHPDDINNFMNFENKVISFFSNLHPEKVLKYKTQYDFRVKHANGNYIRLLHQSKPIQNHSTLLKYNQLNSKSPIQNPHF